MSIRVLIADDQALFREGLETLLSVHPDIEVVGQASNGQEAVELSLKLHPAIILMDMQMPVLNGAGATRRLRQNLPGCRVIALTTFDDKETIFDALRAGAAGYLLKDVSSADLANAIRLTARGTRSLSHRSLRRCWRNSAEYPLHRWRIAPVSCLNRFPIVRWRFYSWSPRDFQTGKSLRSFLSVLGLPRPISIMHAESLARKIVLRPRSGRENWV